jgi:integrase
MRDWWNAAQEAAGLGHIKWRFEVALVFAHETGHRIGSIRKLHWSDVEEEGAWIRWGEESDKVSWKHRTPLTEEALAALRLARRNRIIGSDGWVGTRCGGSSRTTFGMYR